MKLPFRFGLPVVLSTSLILICQLILLSYVAYFSSDWLALTDPSVAVALSLWNDKYQLTVF